MDPNRKPRILIVDDHREAADLLAEAMVLMGYDATVAYSSKAALHLATEYLPDIGVIDLVIDGHTVAAKLRSASSTASIGLIALTASADSMSRDQALASGFNRVIQKPAVLGSIIDAIDECLACTPLS